MNPRLRFYMDGALVDEPKGWDTMTLDIERPKEINGLLASNDGTYEFSGSGYQYLSGIRATRGFCALVEILVEEDCEQRGNYSPIIQGYIVMSEVEFNRTNCTAKCQFEDNSFYAIINNNKSLEVAINAGKTKNGLELDLIDKWECQMFDPCTGTTYGARKANAYRAHDVGNYLISFLTDNQVGFRSTIFDFGSPWEGLMLGSGAMIRNNAAGTETATFTLESYLKELSKKIPLGFYIDNSGSKPVFVLEAKEDTFTDNVMLHCPDVNQVIERSDNARNYAAVRFGSGATISSQGCSVPNEPAFPDQIDLVGCKQEEFIVLEQCNQDTKLDLAGDWIVSSNVIEQIFFSFSADYDDKICFLHCDTLDTINTTAEAIGTDIFTTGTPIVYNAALFNDKVAVRHLGGIPNTLVKYLDRPDTGFKAIWTNTETISVPPITALGWTEFYPFPFGQDYITGPLDGYDVNNDYGNGTAPSSLITQMNSRYAAPVPGLYKFRVQIGRIMVTNPGNQSTVSVTFRHYDSGGTLLVEDIQTRLFNFAGTFTEIKDSNHLFMNPGDYVNVSITTNLFSTVVHNSAYPTYFELLSVNSFGGIFQRYDPKDYVNRNFQFRYPMTVSEYKTIQADPRGKITFTTQNFEGGGWIERLKFFPVGSAQGMAEFTLITDGN